MSVELEVLHCDNHVLATVKPAGVACVPDDSGDAACDRQVFRSERPVDRRRESVEKESASGRDQALQKVEEKRGRAPAATKGTGQIGRADVATANFADVDALQSSEDETERDSPKEIGRDDRKGDEPHRWILVDSCIQDKQITLCPGRPLARVVAP